MSPSRWRRGLLASYLYASLPLRRVAGALSARAGRAPVMVLFYHRVADDRDNAWTLPRDRFDAQIRWLEPRFDLISLEEAQRRIRSGSNRRPAVSITFDDGYADNCDHALPRLLERRIPVTYFVTTRHVLEEVPFAHDLAAGLPLRPNSVEQLRALAAAGVEIGAHGRTHADLAAVEDSRRLHEEIVDSARELETAVGRPVRYFAFPYGLRRHLSADAFRLARRAGYEAVCSAYGGYNLPGEDPFHLQRIHADADPIRFKNWLTGDPRKRAVRRFRDPEAATSHDS